jgi:hypothetical protein
MFTEVFFMRFIATLSLGAALIGSVVALSAGAKAEDRWEGEHWDRYHRDHPHYVQERPVIVQERPIIVQRPPVVVVPAAPAYVAPVAPMGPPSLNLNFNVPL